MVAAAGRGGVRWQAWAEVCVGRGGRGGGCLVGQVAPVEVGASIVVRMHLRPRGRVGQRWGVALRADSPRRAQPYRTSRHYSKHGSVEPRHCWFEARRTSSCASVLLTSVGIFIAHC